MRFPEGARVRFGIVFFLIVLSSLILCITITSGAKISIGTIIETKGMVHDSTTISTAGDWQNTSSALLYRDSQITNGGDLLLIKEVGSSGSMTKADKPSGSGTIESQKVLSYNGSGTGSLISSEESVMRDIVTSSGSAYATVPACTFSLEDEENPYFSSSSASVAYTSSSSIQVASRSRISPVDLSYSVAANTSQHAGQKSGYSSISSSFISDTESAGEMNRVTDRSLVSGLFDLFNRVYNSANSVSIQGETKSLGMVSSKTTAEHAYNQSLIPGTREEKSGAAVYADDVLTNGGDFSEIRTLSADETTDSNRIITYDANGSHAMQTEERIVFVKEVSPSASSSGAVCVMAQIPDLNQNHSVTQTVEASSLLFGVESAQIASTAHIDSGDDNRTKPFNINYRADITSPLLFDALIIDSMGDPDSDGLFEDLNGNGRRDLQDLVLLFKNFEGLQQSSFSQRFDYNKNGKMDLADLTKVFRDIRQ